MKRLILALAVAAGLVAAASPARADNLLPGNSTTSTTGSGGNLGANTVLGTTTLSFVTPTFTATVQEFVVRETATGNLVFLYQLANSSGSPDTLRRMTGSTYDSFTTDVFVATTNLPSGFAAGTVSYDTADRSSENPPANTIGNVMGFNFNPVGTQAVRPGTTTNVLAVRTNATDFDRNGFVAVSDRVTAFANAFQPIAVARVPEPASLVLFGGCFAGLGAARAWRRRRGAPA